MVRSKSTQKVKSKPSAISSKVVKKAVKSTCNLSNGYKNMTEALIESDNVGLPKPAATIAKTSIERITETISISSSKPSGSIKLETATELATPEIDKDAIVTNENEDQVVNDKSKIKENVKIVSQPSKSQKRRAVPIKKEIISADEASTKNKTKEKKQKIALEVPSRNSLPSSGQLGVTEDIDGTEKPLLDLPRSTVVPAGGMHSVCLANSGENPSRNISNAGQRPHAHRLPRRFQYSTEFLWRTLPSSQIIEEIANALPGHSWQARLKEATERYFVTLFENSYTCTINSGRAALKVSDRKLALLSMGTN